MDVGTIMKKSLIFTGIAIFLLMALSLIPAQILNKTDTVMDQNSEMISQTDATKQYTTYHNATVAIEVVELDQSLIVLQNLINEESVNLVASSIFSTEDPSTTPVATFVIEVPLQSMNDFFGKVSSVLQVTSIQTYTDTETLLVEGIDSWIKNLSIQEQRYQELLVDAYELEEILNIEKELSRVRTELDEWELLKQQRDTVTVTISFHLVKDPMASWQESIRDELVVQVGRIGSYSRVLVIKLIGILPYVAILLVMVILGRMVFKRGKRRR